VVHLLPLPGSPRFAGDMQAVIRRAESDARAYEAGGAHAVIVENYGDAPFRKGALDAESVAALTRCTAAVIEAIGLPVGVNALRNDARAALGVAAATGAAFIRVNVHAGVVATDQGLIEGRADETLRVRKALGADIRIAADVHVKHGRTLHAREIGEAASDLAERAGADAIIVSGAATGTPTDMADLQRVREALPQAIVMVGSGVTEKTAPELMKHADALIVGTAAKKDGQTANEVDTQRVSAIAATV
jgi:membrane complex biogenesis BtpA family protein